jgi:hypothetical protein
MKISKTPTSLCNTDHNILGKLLKIGFILSILILEVKFFFLSEYEALIYPVIFGACHILKYQKNIVIFASYIYKQNQK